MLVTSAGFSRSRSRVVSISRLPHRRDSADPFQIVRRRHCRDAILGEIALAGHKHDIDYARFGKNVLQIFLHRQFICRGLLFVLRGAPREHFPPTIFEYALATCDDLTRPAVVNMRLFCLPPKSDITRRLSVDFQSATRTSLYLGGRGPNNRFEYINRTVSLREILVKPPRVFLGCVRGR